MRSCSSRATWTYSSATSPCEPLHTIASACIAPRSVHLRRHADIMHMLFVYTLWQGVAHSLIQPHMAAQVQHGDEADFHLLVAGRHLLHARAQGGAADVRQERGHLPGVDPPCPLRPAGPRHPPAAHPCRGIFKIQDHTQTRFSDDDMCQHCCLCVLECAAGCASDHGPGGSSSCNLASALR